MGGDMHEITLCQRALELIEQQAAKHGAKRVTGVWLKIGAFSCVETSSLAFCFDLVCRGSVAEGCKLHLEEQEAECWCETCQQYVTLLTQRVRRCPQCHGDMLQIVADDGLQIRRIEIDQSERCVQHAVAVKATSISRVMNITLIPRFVARHLPRRHARR